MGVGLLAAPLAYSRYGGAGLGMVAAAAAVIVSAVWMAAWTEHHFTSRGQVLAGLLAPSGVRLALPLALAMTIVVWGRSYISPQVALYIVPLYLAMLLAETVGAVRRHDSDSRNATGFPGLIESASPKRG